MCVEWRYLNGSAAMGERWCRGEVGYERKDRVLDKGSASGREEAALALALGADQGVVGAERSDRRARR